MRDLQGPVAASAFAGLLGAGLIDVLVTVFRADGPAPFGPLLLLAIGLYGLAGLIIGVILTAMQSAALGALPGGWPVIRYDDERDREIASRIIAALVGVLVLATATAVGQRLFVGKMASQKLAAIASAGIVLLASPVAGAVALGIYPTVARAIAERLPRPGKLGATGLLLLVLLGGGVLAGIFALSRADWRVLDLGPLVALALAAVLGAGHGLFWYRTKRGTTLARQFSASGDRDPTRGRRRGRPVAGRGLAGPRVVGALEGGD